MYNSMQYIYLRFPIRQCVRADQQHICRHPSLIAARAAIDCSISAFIPSAATIPNWQSFFIRDRFGHPLSGQ